MVAVCEGDCWVVSWLDVVRGMTVGCWWRRDGERLVLGGRMGLRGGGVGSGVCVCVVCVYMEAQS